ncbi:MAG: DUF975 family protein [Lachnospiraceae bacterium]|nr:DUF975 family protein [Lachnospiraceae bacterium]
MYNEEKNIKTLFANARGQLIGKFGPVIGALVTINVISVLASYIPLLVSKNTDFSFYLSTAASLIISLFLGVFYYALSKMYLKIARGNEAVTIGDIFRFRDVNIDKILIIRAFPIVIEIIFSIVVFNLRKALWGSVTILGWVYLIALVQSLIIFILDFFLLFANFILADNPEMPIGDILRKSSELLKGKRIKYLLMALLFFLLRFAGAMACGIGVLWVTPFEGTVKANFYLDAIGEEPLTPEREQNKPDVTL